METLTLSSSSYEEIGIPCFFNLRLRSFTDLLEKDKHNIFEGSTSLTSIKYFTFAIRVLVLPVPAPAIIWIQFSSVTTASLCLSFKFNKSKKDLFFFNSS